MSEETPSLQGRWIRWIKIISSAIVILIILGIVIGFSAKKYIESHSEEWMCRKVSIGSLYVNFFTSSVTVNDFKVYEKQSDSVFFSLGQIYVNAVPYKLMFSKFEVEELFIAEPKVNLILQGETFNFDDILACFSSTDTATQTLPEKKFDWGYKIKNITLTKGGMNFFYTDFRGGLSLEDIQADCRVAASSISKMDATLDFTVREGGKIRTQLFMNMDSASYQVHIEGDSIGLHFILPFIDKFLYVTDVRGRIDARLTVGGKFTSAVSEAIGFVRLTDFQMIDTTSHPSLGVSRFEILADTVSALKGDYALRHVLIDDPYFRMGITPYGNTLLRPDGSVSKRADTEKSKAEGQTEDEYVGFFKMLNQYFLDLGREYAIHYYAIDTLLLTGGKVQFDDYTLQQPMQLLLENINFEAGHLYSDQDSIKVKIGAKLNHSGLLGAELALMPKDTGDLKLDYTVNGLKISDFSPYSEYYVAHPFWDGVVYYDSHTTIHKSELDSKNHIVVKHIEVGDKVKNKTAYNLPLKFAVALLKDVNGDIEMTVPVRGNVNDPKFKPFPIIVKIFKDLIVKAVSSPYKLLARSFNASEDDLRDVKFDYLQSDIRKRQEKSLDLLARVLKQKKELEAKLFYMTNMDWEKEQYALFEAKRKYYSEVNQKMVLTQDDSVAIDQITRLDSAFNQYLKIKSGLKTVQNVEATCIKLIGDQQISDLLNEVNTKRVLNLTNYLNEKIGVPNRFTVQDGKSEERLQYRERPKFLILFEAKGDSVRNE